MKPEFEAQDIMLIESHDSSTTVDFACGCFTTTESEVLAPQDAGWHLNNTDCTHNPKHSDVFDEMRVRWAT